MRFYYTSTGPTVDISYIYTVYIPVCVFDVDMNQGSCSEI